MSTERKADADVSVLVSRLTPRTRAAIDTACRIARDETRDLSAIFVEDVEIIYSATLPFTRELDTVTAARRSAEPDAIVRALAREAEQIAAHIGEAAKQHGVRASFRVARGTLLEQARQEAQPGRVIVVGAAGIGVPREPSRADASHHLIAAENVVAFAGSPQASTPLLHLVTRALPATARLTVCLFDAPAGDDDLEEACRRAEEELGRKVQWVRQSATPETASIAAALDRMRPHIIGFSRDVLDTALAEVTLALRRLGGTVLLRD